MNRSELIELGNKILNYIGTQDEIDEMIEVFNKNVKHPMGANLFFYPENYNARRDDLSKYKPKVENIVDKCLNYNNQIS